MSTETSEKAKAFFDELVTSIEEETRARVEKEFKDRLTNAFGSGFTFDAKHTNGVNGNGGSVSHVTEKVKSRHVTAARRSTAATKKQEQPRVKKKLTKAEHDARLKSLAKARKVRSANIRARKRAEKKKK